MNLPADPEPTIVKVNPSRSRVYDDAAHLIVGRRGSGAFAQLKLVGQRGGARTEEVEMTDAMRRRVIIALGGSPLD